jgi:pyrroline-5-carboxylate reductase
MDDLRGVRIGVIGAGAIGGALIERLLSGAGSSPADIVACEPKDARREEIAQRYRVRVSADPAEASASDIVVLAAPPLEIKKILQALAPRLEHRPLVVSFAGAVPLKLLEAALPAKTPVVRVNPNSPLIVGAGYNPVVYGLSATGTARALAERFLRLLGKSPIVEDAQMNLYTAITAVGPTYFLPVFDALISAAMEGGLLRPAAIAAAVETARGCADMIGTRPEDPEQLKLFTGLRPLQDAAVRDLVKKAISDAATRMEAVQKQASS